MRKSFLLALISLSVLLVGLGMIMLLRDVPLAPPVASTPLPAGEVARISVQELHARLQGANPPLVWEIRSAESYARQHIPGSQLLSLDDIEASAQGLDRTQPIVALCA